MKASVLFAIVNDYKVCTHLCVQFKSRVHVMILEYYLSVCVD